MATYRQAVVVIHGMGEQSPMGISRSMADVAIPDRSDDVEPKYYSRPDKVSPANQYDLRRLLAPQDGPRLQTEFYEYHWAHLMSGNKLVDLLPLLRSLFRKVRPSKLGRLRSVWNLLVFIAVVMLALVAFGFFVAGNQVESWDLAGIIGVIGITGVWAAVVTWAFKFPTRFLTGWFADAARYWNDSPKNQDARNKIRAGMINLLDALHQSGRYDRVIIAAHSLGSVIAYDAIGYAWARYNKLHAQFTPSGSTSDSSPQAELVTASFTALSEFETAARALNDAATGMCDVAMDQRPDLEPLRTEYREAQWELWKEMRCNGSPWLVTDLVSFGSPLAHASVLIADGPEDLTQSVRRREWPSIPPQPDQESAPGKFHWECEGDARLLYHGAAFGPVRWTNLWYDEDSFGGPIDCLLGPGVANFELSGDGGRSDTWLLAHTDYLEHADRTDAGGATASLRAALDLSPESMPSCRTPSGRPPKPDPASAGHTSKSGRSGPPGHDPEV